MTTQYTGKINWDAKTGDWFTVEGEVYRVLDSYPSWIHFANVLTGERFRSGYRRLIERGATYTAPNTEYNQRLSRLIKYAKENEIALA